MNVLQPIKITLKKADAGSVKHEFPGCGNNDRVKKRVWISR
jgi:hypothetical protein